MSNTSTDDEQPAGRFVYPTPFDYEGWQDPPRTVVEQSMCTLSATLRDKSQWWIKMKDPDIRATWRAEALAHTPTIPEWKLTEKMVDYVLEELEAYAEIMDLDTGIQVGCYDRVWMSDTLVTPADRAALLEAVSRLEDIPDEQRDWHPGSNGQVLNLVHPSLYPIVYGKTMTQAFVTLSAPAARPSSYFGPSFLSQRFAWLPSDFTVSQDGMTARLISPYINNIHLECNYYMYPLIERFVALSIPMFERVLSDLRRPLTPHRVVTERVYVHHQGELVTVRCIWPDGTPPSCLPGEEDVDWDDPSFNEEEWCASFDAYLATVPRNLPQALDHYSSGLDTVKKTVELSGKTIQVIVKLANIILTPENPGYGGGSWHVEGMENEGIVATFIYYYGEDNILESRLAFRSAVSKPPYHDQNDDECMRVLYDIDGSDWDSPQVQSFGETITRQNQCIAFPNIYQHQVQPFKLADPTKPGHRKILALFLINPSNPVPSATTVPYQQREWIFAELQKLNKLPTEIIDAICDFCSYLPTLEETKKDRAELMEERSVMVETNTKHIFLSRFNMCEH